MKRLVRYKLSFTTLLNYQLYKWVKISLEGRFVSSYLLLSSMDSQKKNPKLLNFYFVFRKCNLLVSHESLPSTVLIVSI